MNELHLDLHSTILLELAEILADSRAKSTTDELDKLINRCPDVPIDNGIDILTRYDAPELGRMTQKGQQTINALVQYTVRASKESQLLLMPRLLAYIRHLPAYQWEPIILKKGPPPSDMITYSLVAGLLKIADQCPEVYDQIIQTLWRYVKFIIQIMYENVEFTVTFILPSLAGFLRALQLSPYLYRTDQFLSLYENTKVLIRDDTLDLIQVSITSCLRDAEESAYSRCVLARYLQDGIPLSSNKFILDLLVIFRNILFRILTNNNEKTEIYPALDIKKLSKFHLITEKNCWNLLLQQPITAINDIEEDLEKCLKHVCEISLDHLNEIRKYCQEEKSWVVDAYMQEIMSISLHILSLITTYLQEVDDTFIEYINESLFNMPHVSDPSIHIASLDASALLAINFTRLSLPMINIICQFLAAPLHVFEYQIEGEIGLTNVQQYAIARLAQCIHIKPASQLSQTITFTIHTLLNKTARYTNSGEEDPRINYIPGKLDDNFQDFFKFEELNDEQKEQVCVNVLSSVIGIAIKLKDNYTTSQAFSMIVLRHKTFSAAATASLIMQLVDLALMSPKQTFIDIINYLATYSHESLYNEDNLINTSILSAQLSLAKRLKEQLEYYSLYLHNLLTLFIETANTIQRSLIKNKKEHDYPITKRLGNLLPIISALLEHTDFKPQHDKSNNMTPLFRNLWFHCVLFGFVTESMWIREWNSAMLQIAQKTPILMLEGTTHYFETELEHNSVLCGLQSNTHLASSLRQKLSTYLPTQDLKNLSSAQVTFALTVYHVEMLRSRGGDCAFHLGYFNHVSLLMTELLDTISEHVVRAFIKDASVKAQHQQLAEGLDNQIASLLKFCCHSRQKVHTMAIKTMDRIISAFPQAFTEDYLVTLLLELIQLMWLSCEAEYYDEYSPKFHFTSSLVNITIELSDSYLYRKEVFTKLYESARKWIQASLTRAPIEVSGLLQDYLAKINTEIGPHIGRTLALEMGRKNGFSSSIIPGLSSIMPDSSSNFIENFKSRQFYSGEISGMNYLMDYLHQDQLPFVWNDLQQLSNDVQKKQTIDIDYLHSILHRSASYAISIYMNNISNAYDIVHHLVRIPVLIFTPESLEIGVNIWNWLLVKRPELEDKLITEMIYVWNWAQRNRKGLFSTSLDPQNLFMCQMTYGPPNKQVRDKQQHLATTLFSPHVIWIKFFTSWFYSIRHKNSQLVTLFVRRVLMSTLGEYGLMSRHSLSRYGRFSMIKLGLKVLQSIQLEALAEFKLRSYVYSAAFSWFELPPQWHYGGHKSLALKEVEIMKEVYYAFLNDRPSLTYLVTCTTIKGSNPKIAAGHYILLKDKTKEDVLKHHKNMHRLLLLFIENELTRLSVWCNPLNTTNSTTVGFSNNITEKSIATDETWKEIIRFAWIVSPILTVQMDARFAYQPIIRKEVHRLIANNTLDVIESPEALAILLSEGNTKSLDLKYLQYWAPVPAITAVTYLLPNYTNPLLLQYAVRSLKHHSIDTVFFYIPQIVQALRHDPLGHVEDYILETAATSPLFAHQIIWNMKANFFVDADKECQKPDTLKPILERIIDKIVNNLTGEDQTFYEREFKFFGEVTAISGYLKEYIKHGQNEKRPLQKKRLDEELAKIKVDVGVYLPSNPDGYVIDIDRSSGRPLQSHAKAPFMATFLIEKENLTKYSIWQEAIFKVGDDCRQDVLALQLIAVFKSIFTSIGLDLYVYPYRVVATAPGRGVIDVIPNAISRDQLGREKVNSLYDYFVARYGDGTIDFQRARINFIQSVAAYSVISYILQFKDRHNGNIMIDDEGHMIHIDFGFIFDIAPGGIGFESSPFKLTTEMIQVMGGGSEEQGFRQFSELVVKAYLAARPYAEEIMQLVTLMLQSGLPCFKGDGMTMKRMKTRFQLDKTERSAANFMLMRIKDSFANQRTVLYDYFQKLTNGIPY